MAKQNYETLVLPERGEFVRELSASLGRNEVASFMPRRENVVDRGDRDNKMSDTNQAIQKLRLELVAKEKRRHDVSKALLEPDRGADETKALLDEGTELDKEIAQLQEKIRRLEYPGRRPGEPLNPWGQ
jgi:hypothetical protein